MTRSKPRGDRVGIGCVAVIAVGWFMMNTLVFQAGPFVQPTRFYQLLVILHHPALLLTGVGTGQDVDILLFSLLCFVVLAGALIACVSARHNAWLAGWLPLAFMLYCLVSLYASGAASAPAAAAPTTSLGGQLLHMAHDTLHTAMNQAQARMAGHISVGAGAVLSLLASLALAVRCTAHWRTGRAAGLAAAVE